MSEYTLEIKQIVDYPRCRIYRQFVQALIADRSIRVSGGSGLFYFVVLCAYANFRTSYKRIDGISYTIYPGEWIMSVEELSRYFRTRFRRQTMAALEGLQKKGLISFLVLGHGKLISPFFCSPSKAAKVWRRKRVRKYRDNSSTDMIHSPG